MTWDQIVEIEPALERLYEKAKGYHDKARGDNNFCANRVWYGRDGLKADLCRLVGYGGSNKRLCSPEAYDLAYRKVYDALPNCRHEEAFC